MSDQSSSGTHPSGGTNHSVRTACRDALLVMMGCALFASMINLLRKDGIPFVQQEEYQILVPCPETLGKADPVAVTNLILSDPGTLFLDARTKAYYDQWHVNGAMHVPYDYLKPVDPKIVQSIASSKAKKVIAYGDGADPDSGEHLAKEISARGIRNVGFVQGGAPALRKLLESRPER